MGWVLVGYAIEATPLAVILYALTWRVIGKPKVRPLRLDRTWHFIGATTVALGAGVTRLATAGRGSGSEPEAYASAFSRIAALAASISSMFSGCLPPASAKSGRPPPPPPTMGASSLTS